MITKSALKMMRDTYPEFGQVGDDLLPESVRQLEYKDMAPDQFVSALNAKFPDPMSMQELTAGPQRPAPSLDHPMPFVTQRPGQGAKLTAEEPGIAPVPFAAAAQDVTAPPSGDPRGLLGTAADLAAIVGGTAKGIGQSIVEDIAIPAGVVAKAGGATRLAMQGKGDEAKAVLESTVPDLPRTAAVVGTTALGGPIAKAAAGIPGIVGRAAVEGAAFGGAYNFIASTLEGRPVGEVASETAIGAGFGGVAGAGIGKVLQKWTNRIPATPAASRVTGPGAERLGYEPHAVTLPEQVGLPRIRNADVGAAPVPEPNVVGQAQFAEPNQPPVVPPTAANAPEVPVDTRAMAPEITPADLEPAYPGATPAPVDRPIVPNQLPLDASQVPAGSQPIPAAPPASTAGLQAQIDSVLPQKPATAPGMAPEPGVVEPSAMPQGPQLPFSPEPSVRELPDAPRPPMKNAGEAFEGAFPREFNDLMEGKLAPTEAILKAVGPGTIVEDATLERMGRQLDDYVRSKGGTPAPDVAGGLPPVPAGSKASQIELFATNVEADARKRIARRKGRLGAGQDPILTIGDYALIGAARIMREGVRNKTLQALHKEFVEGGLSADQAKKAVLRAQKRAEQFLTQVLKHKGAFPSLKRLLELNEQGGNYPEWYRPAWEEIQRVFGKDADLMAKFVAATSQRTPVERNIELALEAYAQWKTGQKFTNPFGGHRRNLKLAAEGKEISGKKVFPFSKALRLDPQAVTVDSWMSQIYGFGQNPTKGQTDLITQDIRRIAKQTNLTAYEVQERLWMAYRAEKLGTKADNRNPQELFNVKKPIQSVLFGREEFNAVIRTKPKQRTKSSS